MDYVEEGDRLLKREYSLTMKENHLADAPRVAGKELVKETVVGVKTPAASTPAVTSDVPTPSPKVDAQ